MSDETNLRVVLGIKIHQKYLLFTLNQTKQTIESEHGMTGSFQTKSHLEWIRYLEGNYKIQIDGNNVKCNLFAKKNHQKLNMTFSGVLSYKRIDLDYLIEQNIFKVNQISGKVLFKTKYLARLLKINLEMGVRNFVLTAKTKWDDKEMIDISIESKKVDPGRIRIKYESKNNKKLLKSEIKYQNNQLAGCNFQLDFESKEKFLMIAKVKFQDNALEFDIINNQEQRLFINIFLENESILVVRLENSKKTTHVLKFIMTSIFESIHDIDLFFEKTTRKQQILLKLNDFDGNFTMMDNMKSEHGVEPQKSLLIYSNLDFMRNLEITVNLNNAEKHPKSIYIKLNKKFLRLVWNSDPEKQGSVDFELEGPWGNITGVFQFQFKEESLETKIIINDTERKTSTLKAKFLKTSHSLKLQIDVNTPVTEDYELLIEVNKQLKIIEIKLNGLQSKNVYIDLKVQVYQTDEVRGLKGTMTIFWIPTIEFMISATGNIEEMKKILLILEIKYADNFNFRSDLSMERNKEEILLQLDTHFSNLHIVLKMKMDQQLKNFQYFLKVGEQLYSELKITFENESGFEATIDFLPYLNLFDRIKLQVKLDSSFQCLEIELISVKKILTLNLEYENTSENLKIDLSINTTGLTSWNKLKADFKVDFELMEVKLQMETDNKEHNLLIFGKLMESKCYLEIKANLPFFFLFHKNIKISAEWSDMAYKLEAHFNEKSIDCSIVIEDNTIYATLKTPISGFNEVKANLSYISNTKHKSCNFMIQVDHHELVGFIKKEDVYIEVSLNTTTEKFKELYLKVSSYPYTLKFKLNDFSLNILLKHFGENEVDLMFNVLTRSGTLMFDLKSAMKFDMFVNSSLFLKYEDIFCLISFHHETNQLEVRISSSFHDPKRFEIHWAIDDLKVKFGSNSQTWFESSLKYSVLQSWTGSVDFSLFINIFDLKKIKVYSDFSLLDKQKKLAFNLSYGSKVRYVSEF